MGFLAGDDASYLPSMSRHIHTLRTLRTFHTFHTFDTWPPTFIEPIMRFITFLCCILTVSAAAAAERPNVLMIAIDDMNDWVGCVGGHPQAKTPEIDRLAARGTVFINAHCQSPLCNPSRSSLMTGLRPSTTGIYGLAPGPRAVEMLKDHETLPQALRRAGYHTFTCGKVYHDGSIPKSLQKDEFEFWGPAPGMPRPPKRFVETPEKHPAMDWGVYPENDEEQADWKIATAAIGALEQAPPDRPFFVACGFRLPHVPCYASQKWFDLHPEAGVRLPPYRADDRDDLPRFAGYLHWRLPEPRLKWLQESNQWRPLVRAYLASTSFMDSQVGRVLAALKATGREENTIVVLWGDNGWHLGEKGITGKNTLWNCSTRVPLVFAGPGVATGGRCSRPAELLDVFPTLLEMSGRPPRNDLEGHSLVPQLKDAAASRPWPAITTHNHDNHTIRTERWRYIRYADGSEELYDEQADPNEWRNLAADPKWAEAKQEMARWLPKVNRPPAPGSAHRVLTYDPQTKEAVWEGKPIGADEPWPE